MRRVRAPACPAERTACDLLAAAVAEHGGWVEAAALARSGGERGALAFAAHAAHPAHAYYRWRVLEGALGAGPLLEPVTAVRGEGIWAPPLTTQRLQPQGRLVPSRPAEDEGADGGRPKLPDGGGLLTPAESGALNRLLLEELTLSHADVERVTLFALQRPWAASEVVAALCAAAREGGPDAPAGLRLALLYAAHDLLCNVSGSQGPPPPGAAAYLELLQEACPRLFEAAGEAYRASPGHMEREALVERTARMLRIWRRELFFSPDYTLGLLGAVLRPPLEAPPATVEPSQGGEGSLEGDGECERLRELRDKLPGEEMLRVCRRLGLCSEGGAEMVAARVAAHKRWVDGGGGEKWGLGTSAPASAAK